MSGEPVPEEEAYRERCFESFCDFIKERRPPLDFFSFHGYINPDLVAPHTDYHRRMLRKAGYGNVEIHLNEWLCGDRSGYFWRRASLSSVIAAFIAACQHAKNLKIANIYDAKCALSAYAPLFDPILKDISVSLDGRPLAQGSGYSYNQSSGQFDTLPGVITVPAASYAQTASTGDWTVSPGEAVLTVTGTI